MANLIKEMADNFLGEGGNILPDLLVEDYHEKPIMKFPLDVGDNGRPMIKFVCMPHEIDRMLRTIVFPCPQGVSYGDGGSYTSFDVGLIGEIARAFIGKNDKIDPMAALNKSGQLLKNEFAAAEGMGATIIAARTLGGDAIANTLEFANKQVMNPRTNSAFSGNTLRNFQFDFKMIGTSRAEVQEIDAIQRTFREMVYAEKLNKTSSFMLKYPPKWIIKFVDTQENELEFMPKIYSCYLTAVNTVINSTANTFRKDLSPYEIDMSLQFQETKILTRDEILSLEKDGNRTNVHDEAFNAVINNVNELAGGIRKMQTDQASFDEDKAKEDLGEGPDG